MRSDIIKKNSPFLRITAAFIAALLLALSVSLAVYGETYEEYTIASGDSLSKIASKFGVTVDEIVELNKIKNPDRIEVGTVILIPSSGEKTTAATTTAAETSKTPETAETSGSVTADGETDVNGETESEETTAAETEPEPVKGFPVAEAAEACRAMSGETASGLTVNFKNVPAADALNAVALSGGYTVVCRFPSVKITLSLKGAIFTELLDAIAEQADISYTLRSNTLYAAKNGDLDSLYNDNMSVSSFDLRHTNAETAIGQIKAFEIDVTAETDKNNSRRFVVRGFPSELARVRDLVAMTDVEHAAGADSAYGFYSFELRHASSAALMNIFAAITSPANFPRGLVLSGRDGTLYIYAASEQYEIAAAIAAALEAEGDGIEYVPKNQPLIGRFTSENTPSAPEARIIKVSSDKTTFWVFGLPEQLS